MKSPWFRIIEVIEVGGLSLADICKEVAAKHHVHVSHIRGAQRPKQYVRARHEVIQRAKRERPDLSSNQVARFLGMEGSTIRHFWRQKGGAA